MQASLLKNKKNRKKFYSLEISCKIDKFLTVHLLQDRFFIDKSYLRFINNLLRSSTDSLKSKLKNKCVLTYRSKSVEKKYNISRIILRDMLRSGIFPGYKKAIW